MAGAFSGNRSNRAPRSRQYHSPEWPKPIQCASSRCRSGPSQARFRAGARRLHSAATSDLRRKLVSEQGQGVFIPPPPPTSFGIPENHPSADWVKRHLTPHPVSTFDSPSKSPTQSWIGGASSSATPTGRRWPMSISRRSLEDARRRICSPATGRGASRRTLQSCLNCCSISKRRGVIS
jgi:hypothetical protein